MLSMSIDDLDVDSTFVDVAVEVSSLIMVWSHASTSHLLFEPKLSKMTAICHVILVTVRVLRPLVTDMEEANLNIITIYSLEKQSWW